MSPRVDTITVNYQCADEILGRLDVVTDALKPLGNGIYWIVDNASPDGSGAVLEQALRDTPGAQFLSSEVNGGFGAGNNVAIRAALADATPPDYIYLLNPDADPQPGAIAAMCDFLDAHPKAGVVGSALCDETGEVQTSMFRFPSFLSEIELAMQFGLVRKLLINFVQSLDTPDTPQQVDWVTGASFMVRREVLETVGMFDEAFFLYWEETELCHRIKKAGWEVWALPEAKVMHIGGLTTGMEADAAIVPAYWFHSRDHFYRATGVVRSIGWMNAAVVLGLMFRRFHQGIRGRAFNNPGFLRDFIKYNNFFYSGPPGGLRHRSRSQ